MWDGAHERAIASRVLFSSVLLVCALATVALTGCTGLVSSGGGPPPPSLAISNVQAASATTSGFQVTWTTNVAASSAIDYGTTSAYGSSTPVNSAMVTSHQVALSNLTAGTLYHFRVRSTDSNNNAATSGDVTFSTAKAGDTTPPTVLMTAPANGATVSGTVTVSANATDNVAVASVQFQLDGANLGAATTTAPYNFSWDSTKAANGSHTLQAVAKDTSNNSATSAAVTLTVSNVPDTTPPTTPTGLTATAVSSSQISLRWTASMDNVGVAGYKVFRGGTQVGTSSVTTFQDGGLAASTQYTYTVSAYDAAGNVSPQSAPASATTLASGGGTTSAYGMGWNEVLNTDFSTICPNTSTFVGINGTESCKGVTDDWNGGWADWKRQRLEWWGGGHAGYYGNEVYFFDLASGMMGRYTDPASNPTSQCNGTPLQNLVWQNTTPNVPHGYAGMAYIGDQFDKMFYTMGDMSRGTNTCPASPVNSTSAIRADAWTFNLGTINQATLPAPAGSWTPLDATTGGAGLTFQKAAGCVGTCANPGWGRFQGSVGNSEVGEYASVQTDPRTDIVYVSDGVSMYMWDPRTPTVAQELNGETGGVRYFSGGANGSFIDTDAGTFVIYGSSGIRRFHIDATTGAKWSADTLDNSTTGCTVRGGGLSIGADYDSTQHIAVLWGSSGESTQIIHLFNPKDTAVTVNYQALGLSNHTVNARTCETYTVPLSNTSHVPSLVPTQSGGTGEWGRFRFFHDVTQQDLFATCNNKDTNCFVLALNPPVSQVGSASFASRCAASGVIKCVSFDTVADAPQDTAGNACAGAMPCLLADSNGVFQGHIDTTVAASGGGSLRFDVPASAGQNSSGEARVALGGRFGPSGSAATNGTTFYVQFRFRMDANYAALWKQWAANGEGQKIFAVLNEDSSGGSTCQSEAIVFQNIFYRGFPQAGTNCVNIGLYEGTSPNIKYENGADYQCLQNQALTDSACAMMTWHPNEWYTFYCKFVLPQWDANAASGWNTGHNTIQCWVAREGQPLKQFLNFTAFPLQFQNSLASSGYNALKFYPYDTRRTGGNTCGSGNTQPCAAGKMWYDEVIVSTQPIPAPDGPTPPQ